MDSRETLIHAKNAANAVRATLNEIGSQHETATNLIDHLAVTLDQLTLVQQEQLAKAFEKLADKLEQIPPSEIERLHQILNDAKKEQGL